jgi:hypothetical protein
LCHADTHGELTLSDAKDVRANVFQGAHSERIICANGLFATTVYPFTHFILSVGGYRVVQ